MSQPKESPVNEPPERCGHCGRPVAAPRLVADAHGSYCDSWCRTAAELLRRAAEEAAK